MRFKTHPACMQKREREREREREHYIWYSVRVWPWEIMYYVLFMYSSSPATLAHLVGVEGFWSQWGIFFSWSWFCNFGWTRQCESCTIVFLDASSHLYKRVCPSVGPSVSPSPFALQAVFASPLLPNRTWLMLLSIRDPPHRPCLTHYCPCPTARDWWPCIH